MNAVLGLIAAATIYVMAPFVTLNVILYAYVHNWRATAEGKALMRTFVLLLLLIDLTVLFHLVPWFPGAVPITAAVMVYMLYGVVRFTVLLGRELVRQRRRTRA